MGPVMSANDPKRTSRPCMDNAHVGDYDGRWPPDGQYQGKRASYRPNCLAFNAIGFVSSCLMLFRGIRGHEEVCYA
jgi:hypothetical protein